MGKMAAAYSQDSETSKQQDHSGVLTLRTQSRIVIVDVGVKDARGEAVHGLSASDFTVIEDKKSQNIQHFEERVAKTADLALPTNLAVKLPPNTFTNYIPTTQGTALNIILLDALNTPQSAQPFLRSNLKTLASTLPSGSPVAIFGLSNSLTMLQSFTSDPTVLKAILASPTRAPAAASLQPAAPDTAASLEPMERQDDGSYTPVGFDPGSPLSIFNRTISTQLSQERVRITIDALAQLNRYLSVIPGRKNLIWLSGSFPLSVYVDMGATQLGARTMDNIVDFSDAIARISAELARSRVAIYPVDVRGVQTESSFDASQSTGTMGGLDKDFGRNTRAASTAQAALIQEHASMINFADATGGHAFFGSNDIAGTVIKAIKSGADYYTLTYLPSNSNWNGKGRKIKVVMKQKGYQLYYRSSYIASNAQVTPVTQQNLAGQQRTTEDTVASTMQRGAPNSTEIIFTVTVTPSSVIDLPTIDKAAKKDLAAVSRGPQRRYRIDYAISPDDLAWVMEKNGRNGNIECMVIGYDNTGNIVNKSDRIVPLHLTSQNYSSATHGGIRLSQEIAMPSKGEYYLRVAILDKATNQIGAVEVSTIGLNLSKP